MAIKWSGLKMDVCCQCSCGDLSQLNVSPAIWSYCHRALLADEIYGCSWAAYLQLKNWPRNASAETRGENLHFHLLFGTAAVSSSWEKGKEKSKAKKRKLFPKSPLVQRVRGLKQTCQKQALWQAWSMEMTLRWGLERDMSCYRPADGAGESEMRTTTEVKGPVCPSLGCCFSRYSPRLSGEVTALEWKDLFPLLLKPLSV